LIEQHQIALKLPLPSAEWIFFSSARAVHHFFDQATTNEPQWNYGAIGKATAKAIEKYGFSVGFVGLDSSTEAVARAFQSCVGTAQVLFPIAKESLQTVQQALPSAQVNNVVVYASSPVQLEMDVAADVLVFTSPSNVQSWLEQQVLDANQKMVAIGETTAMTLHNAGCKKVRVAHEPSELAMALAALELL